MASKIQIRRDTAGNWVTVNPILADGEQGHETDTNRRKIGNGVDPWNTLPYIFEDTLSATNAAEIQTLQTVQQQQDTQIWQNVSNIDDIEDLIEDDIKPNIEDLETSQAAQDILITASTASVAALQTVQQQQDTQIWQNVSNIDDIEDLIEDDIKPNIEDLETSQAAQDILITANTTAAGVLQSGQVTQNTNIIQNATDIAANSTEIDTKYDASNPDNFIDASGAPIQTVNGETGDITEVAKTDEANVFTQIQTINNGPSVFSHLNIADDSGTRLRVGYNETVGFNPNSIPDPAVFTAQITNDRDGDIHYATRSASSSFGHRFYTGTAGVLTEILRITSAGLDGLARQAKNFLDPTDPQDLATKKYIDDLSYYECVERVDGEINQTTTSEIYLAETFTVPVTGVDYMVTFFFQYSYDATNSNFQGNVSVNNNDVTAIRHEPQDAGGVGATVGTTTGGAETTGTDQRFTAFYTFKVTATTTTIPTNITWRAQAVGVEAAIYRASIQIRRIP